MKDKVIVHKTYAPGFGCNWGYVEIVDKGLRYGRMLDGARMDYSRARDAVRGGKRILKRHPHFEMEIKTKTI